MILHATLVLPELMLPLAITQLARIVLLVLSLQMVHPSALHALLVPSQQLVPLHAPFVPRAHIPAQERLLAQVAQVVLLLSLVLLMFYPAINLK